MASLGDVGNVSNEISVGESAIFRLDITPKGFNQPNIIAIKFFTPINDSRPMEICTVSLVHAGANLPCLRRGGGKATYESRSVLNLLNLNKSYCFTKIPIFLF